MKNILKTLMIIGGVIMVAAIVSIVVMVNFPGSSAKNGSNRAANKTEAKGGNLSQTLALSRNTVTPNSFMVEYPSTVSLTVVNSDKQAYNFAFLDPSVGVSAASLGPDETKTVTFQAPAVGRYLFNFQVPGQAGKILGEMIVSVKSSQSGPGEKTKTPGASIIIGSGGISPNTFTVAPKAPVSLTFTSVDNRAHEIVFSDASLKIAKLEIAAGETKSLTFDAPQPGEYVFHCDVAGHERETGRMVVAAKTITNGPSLTPVLNNLITSDKIPAGAVKLAVADSGFSPLEFTVKPGAKVTLVLTAGKIKNMHILLFDAASLIAAAAMVGPNETRLYTFTAPTQAGNYPFRDILSEKAVGQMIVK